VTARSTPAAVTIITPYRDGARFLPGFAAMLQRQRFRGWRCLLINDRSADEGPGLAAQLAAHDPRFHPLSMSGPKRSPGPAAARSLGLQQVDTPLVAFCDADDIWHPAKLERQLAFHQALQLDLSVSGYGRFRDAPAPALMCWRCPPKNLTYAQLLGGNPLPMLTVLVRTDLVREGFPACPHEDFALWLGLFRGHPGLRYGCLPEGLAFYRLHAGNLTHQRRRMLAWADAVFRQHGLSRAQRYRALLRWSAYQLQQLCTDRPFTTPAGLALDQLMAQPPVRLTPDGSFSA
jgi:teichuronic acid biosynthesis glycosyltransferase TuaG